MRRFAIFAVVATTLLAAAGASAQHDLGGTVVHVDPGANTITFSDGRIAHYDPLWRILVNGREVAVTEEMPGPVIAVAPSATATTQALVPGAPQPAMAVAPGSTTIVTTSPTVTGPSTGTIARVDETTKTIVLEDGRVLKVTEVQVWRQEPVTTLAPGTTVYVGSMPAATVTAPVRERAASTTVVTPAPGTSTVVTPRTSTTVVTPSPGVTTREMRGRVATVDATRSRIVLSDGRTVLLPSATVQTMNAKTLVIDELKPGDELVIQVQEVIPVVSDSVTTRTRTRTLPHDVTVAAWPNDLFPAPAVVLADRVVLLRYPEAQ